MIKKIISSGQTGADRAALDVAIQFKIPHDGWIPKGRIAEEGPLPDKFQLQEMATGSYPKRTEQNVIDSHGTVIFTHGRLTGGSKLTQKLANQHHKPCLHIDLNQNPDYHAVFLVRKWMYENSVEVLNVAGSRASKDPMIYKRVFDVINGVYSADKIKGNDVDSDRLDSMPSDVETIDEDVNQSLAEEPLSDQDASPNMSEVPDMDNPKEPSSSRDCNNSRLGKILKLVPLIATLVGAGWVLIQFFAFQLEQERLSIELAEQKRILSELEITGKSAFKIQTSPDIDISILEAGNSSTSPSKYLVVWEVGVINTGLRILNIKKHTAEIYLGTQVKKLVKPIESAVVNFPADKASNSDAVIKWEKSKRREFKKSDLYKVPVGCIGPGDTRSGELAAVVRAKPGTWVFTRSEIIVDDEPCEEEELDEQRKTVEQEEPSAHEDSGEKDMHVEWAYEILPEPK